MMFRLRCCPQLLRAAGNERVIKQQTAVRLDLPVNLQPFHVKGAEQ